MTTPRVPTDAEIIAYDTMQARLIDLFLRHDERSFKRYYTARTGFEAEPDDALRRAREFGVLFHLRDELFEHILPRIVRRLSFEAPRSTIIEEPPARGRVNWEQTLNASWTERPGEPPLLLHTRQRRRDFATPENLLVVATLLEYRADIQQLLWGKYSVLGSEALRHPLYDIVERCERELAFPQFAGLRSVAQQMLDGDGTEGLEQQVYENLIPGSNSAYEELLDWRIQRRNLRLLHRNQQSTADNVLGADPARDNYLYQLWIFYELAELLQTKDCLESIDTTAGQMCLQFRWGQDEKSSVYEFRHDQKVSSPIATWRAEPELAHAVPGVRPDFYIQRIEPAPERIEHEGILYWREPGIVWDAKYYRPREQNYAPASPVKRMIADLNLLGEQTGALLFAFLEGQEPTESKQEVIPRYRLLPSERDQTIIPDTEVSTWQLQPSAEIGVATIQRALAQLLDMAHTRLSRPRVPACHGVFLDTLSAAEHTFVDRYGLALESDTADLLICPKPHIGPWRVDLVSRSKHCCQDGHFCQIIGQQGAMKPIRPPRKPEELLKELQQIVSATNADELDDATVQAIAQRVESLTHRFAEVMGVYRNIAVYDNRLRDLGMHRTLDRLGKAERESMALAIFLVEQLDSIGATDYSAPAIHISSVMELEVKRRVYSCPGLVSEIANHKSQTLGKLPFMRWKPFMFDGDWERILAHVGRHWDGAIDPEAPDDVASFEALVTELDQIKDIRNKAAHTHPVSREEYRRLFVMTCQSGRLKCGALNALLLAWRK